MLWRSRELGRMLASLEEIDRKVGTIMANQADLDAALTAWEAAETSALAEINAAVQAILARVSPAIDLSAEVTRIQNAQQALQTAADAINAEANPTPPPVPPVPPTP